MTRSGDGGEGRPTFSVSLLLGFLGVSAPLRETTARNTALQFHSGFCDLGPVLPRPWKMSARFLVLAAVMSSGAPALLAAADLPAPVLLQSAGTMAGQGGASGDAPAFYPFLPPAGKGTGCAVLIVPADGSKAGDLAGEGAQMAGWLNEQGIAGFVLRHRNLPAGGDVAASTEVNQAVQFLRAHAADFKISPRRIGVLGFAAGAELAADAAYNHQSAPATGANDPGEKISSRPDFLALIWGSALPAADAALLPPTFLVGSTRTSDGMSGMIDLWTKLRAARVPVDAHFFSQADPASGMAKNSPSLGLWPGMFYAWVRFSGFLTEEPKVPIKGLASLDGRPLPHGYIIFTPVDFVGTGPVIGRVINSTAGIPIGEFSVPAEQGPLAGRYKVDVRQNMNRWLSNSFSGELVNARGGATPAQAYFGHHRLLGPSIDDQHSFTKVHPTDREDFIIEFKPGTEANLDLKIEVFSK